jgi:mannosyltransferase
MNRDAVPYVEFGYCDDDLGRSRYHHSSGRLLERYRSAIIPDPIKVSPDDIFHSTCYRLPNVRNCRVLTTVHDFTYEIVIKGLRGSIHTWQKNNAVLSSDFIICVSNNTKEDLLRFVPGIDENKIAVVYNGATDNYCYVSGTVIKPYVLHVGQRYAYKNFSSLVLAMRTLKDFELVCVGGGGFSKKEIAFLDSVLPNRYRHLGYVTEEQLNRIYNEAFCFVYPSLYEGFGIPVIESMKAGCPVVAVNGSSIPEVAGDAAILVDEGDCHSIEEGIREFLKPSVRNSCVEKGLTWSTNFSWEKCYSDTMAVYRGLGLG